MGQTCLHHLSFDTYFGTFEASYLWIETWTNLYVLFPNLSYRALPYSGTQQYCPRPPDMPPKLLEVEDSAMFWLTK